MPGKAENAYVSWHLAGETLHLRLPNGQNIKPSAKEVIGAEFKGRLVIQGQTIEKRPSEAIADVEFFRFPPDILIRVYPPASDLSAAPRCELELVLDGISLEGNFPMNIEIDQMVRGGKWLPLAPELINEAKKCLSNAGINETGNLTLRQYVKLLSLQSDIIHFKQSPPALIQVLRENEPSLPDIFNATLYPYQKAGVSWLNRIVAEEMGCILADEMGLGKTIQVIAVIATEVTNGRSPSLVVAPATLMENWRRELAKFTPTLKVLKHRGKERTGFPATLKEFNVVLTTYDTALRDLSLFKMILWNIVVLDEAQAIKTPNTQRAMAIKQIPRRIGISVTGTPVENKLRDLWSLMDFSVPGFLGSLSIFEKTYEDSPHGAGVLEPLVSPLLLRRKMADVATDLPPRIDMPQPIELSDEAAVEYESIRTEIINQYGASASLVSIIRLRLFCAHPFLVNERLGDPLAYSTKYARLLEILDEIIARNEKVLIFTSFTKMADIINKDIAHRYGIPGFILDGRTPVENRQPVIDYFQGHLGSAFLVLNPKAGGVGLNISEANHVIHYNLEWNPAVEDQATARAYRRGQTRPVTVHRLFHIDTIEEIMDQRMMRKRDMSDAAVIGVEGAGDIADILRAIELSPLRKGEE